MATTLFCLPQLVLDEVFGHCSRKDLMNFATCSKQCPGFVCHLLWESMNIQWALLDNVPDIQEKTKYIGSTKSLKMYNGFISSTNSEFGIGKCVYHGFNHILNKCDAAKLRQLQFQGYIPPGGLKLASTILTELEHLVIHNVQLPEDEWKCIAHFRKLKMLSVYNCNMKDDFLDVIAEMSIRELSIRHCTGVDSHLAVRCASRMKMLESLTHKLEIDPDHESNSAQYGNHLPVKDVPFTLASLFKNGSLKKLRVSHEKLQDELFEGIADVLGDLTVLNVNNSTKYFTDEMLKHVSKLSKLKVFSLMAHQITDKGIAYLSTSRTLENLVLSNIDKVTDTGLALVAGMPCLKGLSLSFSEDCGITNKGFRFLSGPKTITEFHLNHCDNVVSNKVVKYIARFFKELKSLSLNQSENLTDAGLKYVSRISCLRGLSLSRCSGVTDQTMMYITHLSNLRELDVSETEITCDGLACIINLPLEELRLGNCKFIDDEGLYHVSKIKSLIALELLECDEISDEGLEYISELCNLRTLDLCFNTQLTNDGIKHLSDMPNLKYLAVEGCSVTEDVLMEMSKFKIIVHNITDFHMGNYYAFEGEVNY